MLTITDLTYRIAGRTILDQANLTLAAGQRAGLIGRNGTGKSTLLKLIYGKLHADGGEIRMAGKARIGMLAQEAPSGPESLLDTVLAADLERASLLDEAEHCTEPNRIAEIQHRLIDIDAHAAPARAAEILAGLGFDAEAQARPCSDFSGGWRMRVALAAVLFSAPDLLLLDEPTNHLDLEATLWLEDYLRRYPHTILIVSHDRELLNKAVERIIHLHDNKLTVYGGNYDTFEKTRAEKLALLSATASKQDAQRKHMQAFVDRFRYKASKARQAQSRLKALAKLPPIQSVVEDHQIVFDFPEPAELPPPLITLDHVDVGYEPGRPILRNLDLRLDPDDRIALLGANGNGKSTFVKLLAGRLQAMAGDIRRSSKLRVGYFAQHQTDELDMQSTPLETMGRLAPQLTVQQCRAHLGRFDFGVEKVGTKINNLSGGEKARLLLALMSYGAPNILLLDEPTNHLDIDSRRALVEAINGFAGAVVLISHDPTLIELTVDRLWLVKDGTCKAYDGDLDDYRHLLESGGNRAPSRSDGNRAGSDDRKAARRKESAAKAATKAEKPGKPVTKRNLEQSSVAVEKFTQALKLIEAKLADPELYRGPQDLVAEWQRKHADVKRRLGEAEDAWLQAQMALDD
jgi:ATP-binding cassette subfamily F protein 3